MADILDDEKYSYEEFDKKLDNTNSQYFNSLTKEIKDSGDLYVTQITRKQTQEQLKRSGYIKYIIKHSGRHANEIDFTLHDTEELKEIFQNLHEKNQSIFVKFFKFITV